MLFALSGLKGLPVDSSDGRVGTAKDFLFDNEKWRVRWMVVDTGHWLPGRKVLIHPSAIAPLTIPDHSENRLPMMSMGPNLTLSVRLTRQQIEAGPEIEEDAPISRQMERRVSDYYGWDPAWGTSFFSSTAMGVTPPDLTGAAAAAAADVEIQLADGDAHLRSATEVTGYHIHATDGDIGHVENFLADDAKWDIRYLVIATRNWWPGKHVLMAPYAVRDIDFSDRSITLKVTREQVQSSPPWDPAAMVDQITEQQLHSHYGWPGYGW